MLDLHIHEIHLDKIIVWISRSRAIRSLVKLMKGSRAPPEVYYELHNLCRCNACKNLGHIPGFTFGIGYSGRVIDPQTDKWEIFAHAGAEKILVITLDTPTETMIMLRDFVKYVDECEEERAQIPNNMIGALLGESHPINHFNNAKTAQKNAEELFRKLKNSR